MTNRPGHLKPVAPESAPVEAILDRIVQAVIDNDHDTVVAATDELFQLRDEVAPVIGARLLEGRTPVPAIELELLVGLAGEEAYPILEEVVEQTDLDDLLRFEAQRMLGWPEAQQKKRRRDVLDTLQSPTMTLVRATGLGLSTWPPMIEQLEEVLHYLVAMPSDRRQQAVTAIIGEIGKPSAWLLRGLLHVREAALQRMILDQLLAWQDRASAGAARRLAATARSKRLREEAATVAARLDRRLVNQGERDGGRPMPPVVRAALSEIDGDGGQVVILIRGEEDEHGIFFDAFHNELVGIKALIGRRTMPQEEIGDMLEDFEVGEVELLDVDPAEVRGALSAAVDMNARAGKLIPPAFELWEPLLHDQYPAAAGESVIVPMLDDAPFGGRGDLVAESAELYGHIWFSSWLIPIEDVFAAMAEVPPPAGGVLTDREYEELIPRFFLPAVLVRLRERLRRQAWMLEREDEAQDRDLALAVAASLKDADAADLIDHPFIREMTRRSVENAIAAFYWGVP